MPKIGNLRNILGQPNSHSADITKIVMISDGEVPNVTQLAQATFLDGAEVEPHSHSDMHEVYMVDEGEAQITVAGVTYDVKKGSFVVVNPGEVHSIRNTKGFVMRYFGLAEKSKPPISLVPSYFYL